MLRLAAWRNWQTQETQNLPGVTPRVGSIPSAATKPPCRLGWQRSSAHRADLCGGGVNQPRRSGPSDLALEVNSLRRPRAWGSRSRSIPRAAGSESFTLRRLPHSYRESSVIDDDVLRTRATYDAIASRFIENARDRIPRHPMARPLRGRVAGGRAGRRPWRGAGDRHRRTPPSRAPRIQPRLLDGHAARGCRRVPGPAAASGCAAAALPRRRSCGHLGERVAAPPLATARGAGSRRRPPDARAERTAAPLGQAGPRHAKPKRPATACRASSRSWSGSELDAVLDAAGFRVIDGGTETSPRAEWLVRLAERID